MERSSRRRGSFLESFLIASASAMAFILWGLWVNWEYGIGSRIQVALTQAAISFLATFFSAELLVWIAHRLRKLRQAWAFTAVVGWIAINAIVWIAHRVLGTPEILETMVLGMVTGAAFCAAYSHRLTRH